MKKISGNLLLLLISSLFCFVAAEFVFQKLLFSKSDKFKFIQREELYANQYNDDDYWKLHRIFGGQSQAPEHPQPLLGWIGNFNRETLKHNNGDSVKEKRPVLLFGDSFAQGVDGVVNFQSILNNDTSFSSKNYLLNYGVAGYGVDQIQLLLKHTYKQYKNPFVIFSITDIDLDRSLHTNRGGQKPYYRIEDDSLVLKGVPLESNPQVFFQSNPPEITSYLWRRFIYTTLNPMPESMKVCLRGEEARNNLKMELNNRIMKDMIDELRQANIQFVFLVFNGATVIKDNEHKTVYEWTDDWRGPFLEKFIEENKLPFIWTQSVVKQDSSYSLSQLDKYFIVNDGHPTTYLNRLVAEDIKKFVLASETAN